jgi:hypothetical protein
MCAQADILSELQLICRLDVLGSIVLVALTGVAVRQSSRAAKRNTETNMKSKTTAAKSQTPSEKAKTSPKPPKKADATPAKSITPRKGTLGLLLGHSVVSVIRAMGKNGWTYETARAALDKAGIEAATHTVKVGLKRGRDGQKRIAPLSAKDLAALKAK